KASKRSPYTAVHVNAPALVPVFPSPGQDGGFLGRDTDPLIVGDLTKGTDSLPNMTLPPELPPVRIEARRSWLDSVDRYRLHWQNDPAMQAMDTRYSQAFAMLADPHCREAFNLEAEPAALRDRYGRHRSGQACLLARRLAEAEVPLITVVWNHSGRGQDLRPDDPDAFGWDTHNDIFNVMRDHLLPRFDQSVSALLDDLDARGLLDQTLVIIMGEFGRAPRVALEPRFAGATPGRKHWANVYSIVVAGAGVSRGAVFGSSDKIASAPQSDRVAPWDVAATALSALGIDPGTEYFDPVGRPFTATLGQPITGLYHGS
ncbi:MAG: DUF1501 domain-containing protein, partial [Isosphaeraceae bacterium]